MEPMSIIEIARFTKNTPHMVTSAIKRLGLKPTHTERIGRFPRQYFQPEQIIENLSQQTKPRYKIGSKYR